MRASAAIWLATGALALALRLVSKHIVSRVESGVPFDEIKGSLELVSWSSTAVHVLGTSAIAFVAGVWARASAAQRDRWLVHCGRVVLVLALVLHVAQSAALWSDLDHDDVETVLLVQIAAWYAWYLGPALLVAGTRAPLPIRVGYCVMATSWVAFVMWADTREPRFELPVSLSVLTSALFTVLAAAALWLAAPRYADVEPEPTRTKDAAHARAAEGLALLRTAVLGRIVLAILSVVLLVAARGSPGVAGALVWMLAVLQCALAAVIWIALTRYGSLADDAVERFAITLVIVCTTIGATLELYGASLMSELFRIVATSMGMPSLSKLEKLQTTAQWIARLSSIVGLVAAVALALSLRRTASWLGDLANARRASTIIGLTIVGGGTTVVLMAVAQSGTLGGAGPLGAMMVFAIAIAIVILAAWMRLFGELIAALRRDPPESSP